MRADRELRSPVSDWEPFDRLQHDGSVWIVKSVRRDGEGALLRLAYAYEVSS